MQNQLFVFFIKMKYSSLKHSHILLFWLHIEGRRNLRHLWRWGMDLSLTHTGWEESKHKVGNKKRTTELSFVTSVATLIVTITFDSVR